MVVEFKSSAVYFYSAYMNVIKASVRNWQQWQSPTPVLGSSLTAGREKYKVWQYSAWTQTGHNLQSSR